MGWKKSVPAVLLLSLAIPAAQVNCGNSLATAGATPTACQPVPAARSGALRIGRRREFDDPKGFSPETIALAGEYVRCRANGTPASAEANAAWLQFYAACDAAIRRFARACGNRESEVDDCAQGVWADLMIRLPEFRMDQSRGRFSSWLYTLVRNKSVDMRRRRIRRTEASLSVTAGEPGSAEADPARAYERKLDRQSVRSALSKLRQRASDLSYRVLHLRYIEGRRVREVAQALGLTREQVWVREHRMKQKLRGLLELADGRISAPVGTSSGHLSQRIA